MLRTRASTVRSQIRFIGTVDPKAGAFAESPSKPIYVSATHPTNVSADPSHRTHQCNLLKFSRPSHSLPFSASLSPSSPSADRLPSAFWRKLLIETCRRPPAICLLEEASHRSLLSSVRLFLLSSRQLSSALPPSVSSSLLPVSPPPPPRCYCLSVPVFFSVASSSPNLLQKSPALPLLSSKISCPSPALPSSSRPTTGLLSISSRRRQLTTPSHAVSTPRSQKRLTSAVKPVGDATSERCKTDVENFEILWVMQRASGACGCDCK